MAEKRKIGIFNVEQGGLHVDTANYDAIIGLNLILKDKEEAYLSGDNTGQGKVITVVKAPDSVGTIQSYVVDSYGNIHAYVTGGSGGNGWTYVYQEKYSNPELSIVPESPSASLGVTLKAIGDAINTSITAGQQAQGQFASDMEQKGLSIVKYIFEGVGVLAGFIILIVIINNLTKRK